MKEMITKRFCKGGKSTYMRIRRQIDRRPSQTAIKNDRGEFCKVERYTRQYLKGRKRLQCKEGDGTSSWEIGDSFSQSEKKRGTEVPKGRGIFTGEWSVRLGDAHLSQKRTEKVKGSRRKIKRPPEDGGA